MIKSLSLAVTLLLTLSSLVAGQIDERRARDPGRCNATKLNPHWKNVEDDEYKIAEGVVQQSIASYTDFPLHHWSHDWDFEVKLDDAYKGLTSTANPAGRMAFEWEMNNYPIEFRPMAGDRVWAMGRWIWDCGHEPYKTEFHPPIAMALTRDQPSIFPKDVAPSVTRKTYVYVHGDGGYNRTAVTGRDYEFDIALPAKPKPDATARAEVIAVPYGNVSPILRVDAAGNKVHVIYPLRNVPNASPDLKFGAIILSGWTEPKLSKPYRELRVSLDNVKINNNHAGLLDTGGGNWHMWVQAGQQWLEVLRSSRGPGNRDPQSVSGDVDDGQTVTLNRSVSLIVPDDGSVPVVLRSTGWESNRQDDHFGIDNRPNPADVNIGDDNDRLGVLDVTFSNGQNFGIGAHDDKSKRNPDPEADRDTNGDFNLRYRIEEVKKYPAGTATGPTPPAAQCVSTNESFLATTRDENGNVVPFPSFEPLSGDSRVTIDLEVVPYRVKERDASGRIVERMIPQKLLVQLPGQASKVKLESGAGPSACHYYFGQLSFGKVKADEVLFEFQLEGRPYEGRGPKPVVNESGKLARWSSYGMTITIREDYYYGKGKD